MKKTSAFFVLLFVVLSFSLSAQNVGIGAAPFTPNTSAGLDIDFLDKGLLIPRVALTASNAIAPITSAATSLLVYNTATAGAAPNSVSPGYYYWDGTNWLRFFAGNDGWKILGNSNTAIATNFLGTTDNVPFAIRTNNLERMRITDGVAGAGQVAINTTNPATDDAFSSYATATRLQAISGYGTPIANGIGVYGEATVQAGVFGAATTGVGVYGINNSTSNGGTQGFNQNTIGTGGIFAGNNLAGTFLAIGSGISGRSSGVGVYGEAVYTASNFSDGVRGVANITNGTGVRGTSSTASGVAMLGLTSNAASMAAIFSGNGAASNYPAAGGGVAGNGTTYGVSGYAAGANGSAGGYFQTGTAYAYVGVRNGGINYKIIGSANVSTIVRDLENKRVVMFCPEAPEVLFQDFGTGKLEGGFAHINLDPIFSKNITVNEKHPLRIFIQLEGECNGVYVTNKTATSFDVKELQNGNSSVAFTWFVTANRSNEVNPETGEVESAHVDARFPEGLGPQETKIRDVGSEQEQGYIEIKKIKNNK